MQRNRVAPTWPPSPIAIVGVAAGAYALVLLLYFIAFGRDGCCDTSKWGEFGDFVGGVLNPLLVVFSVWLLARTLQEQQRFVEETKRLAVVEEVQRFLSSTSRELNEALSRRLHEDGRLEIFFDWPGIAYDNATIDLSVNHDNR